MNLKPFVVRRSKRREHHLRLDPGSGRFGRALIVLAAGAGLRLGGPGHSRVGQRPPARAKSADFGHGRDGRGVSNYGGYGRGDRGYSSRSDGLGIRPGKIKHVCG